MPTMKIVGLPPFTTPVENVVANILESNGINKDAVVYLRHFSVDLIRRRYTNILVNCTIDILKNCMKNGLQYGKFRLRCYEHVRAIQFLKCYAFGHVAANCLNKLTCKRCADEHIENECKAKENEIRCANCLATKRPHDHRITSENCPSRRAWINRRINFLGKKIQSNQEQIA